MTTGSPDGFIDRAKAGQRNIEPMPDDSALVEAVARRLARWAHPRKPWPDELNASVSYRDRIYREPYLQQANVLIHMIRGES